MKCVALGQRYEIPFCSRQDYLYAPDVGAAFANATLETFTGFAVFTLPGHTANTAEVIAEIRRAAPRAGLDAGDLITAGTAEVPFICDLDYRPFLQAFPKAPHTPLAEAVEASLSEFKRQRERGWLKV
jgi:hypothetical protein